MKRHMGRLFVQAVANAAERAMVNDGEDREEEARRMTVNASLELGGSVEQLGKAFEQVWKTTSVEDDDLSYFVGLESAEDCEIEALFTALVLYRRAFATDLHPECGSSSTLLSPPPNPTLTTRSVMHQAPVTATTCRVFLR